MKYLIVIEPSGTGFSSHSPDPPGHVPSGMFPEEVERNMREVIELNLEGMREEGYSIPGPRASSIYIEAAVQATTW